MNILVTGAKGFIGKNLIATLHNIAAGKDQHSLVLRTGGAQGFPKAAGGH